MAVAVSDTAAMAIAAAINNLIASNEKQYGIMNTYLTSQWSVTALKTPGTPTAIMKANAQAMNDVTVLLASMIDQQKKLIASIQVIQSGIASVSANVSAGVTTQQLAVADQIKNNQFQQLTTNAALERADLPKTVVNPADIQTQVQSAVQDTLTVKTQVKASALVEEQITSAVAWTTTTASNIVAQSFVGTAATNAWNGLKKLLKITDPPVTETAAETKAATRNADLLDPKVLPGPSVTTLTA